LEGRGAARFWFGFHSRLSLPRASAAFAAEQFRKAWPPKVDAW